MLSPSNFGHIDRFACCHSTQEVIVKCTGILAAAVGMDDQPRAPASSVETLQSLISNKKPAVPLGMLAY
jgi:hypothetical protein